MTDHDLLDQLAAYGDHHRSEQPPVGMADIVGAGAAVRPLSVDKPRGVGPNARGVGVAVAAGVVVVLLIGGAAWLVGSETAVEPADETTVTTEAATTGGPVIPADAGEGITPGVSVATAGTPLPDIENAALADDGGPPLPLGMVNELPNEDRLNFLFEFCADGCWRDAHFMDPANPEVGSGPWLADRAFHVRHGFVNEDSEPLGPGFDVALYVFPMDGASDFGGTVTAGTSRYTSDYVLRGEADQCGPTYKSQTGPVTCEWFVHDFPEGLPEGRWALWAVWEAPCSAWMSQGLTASCANPNEVMSFFSSGMDSPFDLSGTPFYEEPNMATMSPAEIDEFFSTFEEEGGFEELPPPGPELEIDASGAAATGGTPLPDFEGAIASDDGAERLPLGVLTEPAYEDRLDFLYDAGGFRDAVFVNPDDPSLISGPWQAGRPFIVRHGFINENEEPLGDAFDVVLYVYRWDDWAAMGPTMRYTSDYVLRGTTDECGPTYRSLTGPVTCEWFVHEFHNGLPAGRHALWAFWEAPCSAWVDYGFVDSCADPSEVMALFASGVDSPWGNEPVFWEEH